MADFSGRSALITGAASGMGKALAEWLAERGIERLVLIDRDAAGLAALDLPCTVEAHAADVADPQFWDGIEPGLGRIDHAAINAGIADGCPVADLAFEDWRRFLSVNLDGAFLTLRTVLRRMQAEGGKSIVLTSSITGVRAMAGTAAYGTSKAGVAHLTKVAALEQLANGIRVNAIAPGRVPTPIWTQTAQFQQVAEQMGSKEEAFAKLAAEDTPLGRAPSPMEVAAQMGWLLSDEAWNITGQILVSDGGHIL